MFAAPRRIKLKQLFWLFVMCFICPIAYIAQSVDTINIHKRIVGIQYRKCLKIWFCSTEWGSFSYNILTKQDDYISNDTAYFFKVHGYGRRLILTGKKNKWGDLVGEVTFYYRNGQIEHSEFYCDPSEKAPSDSLQICADDCPTAIGTWTYYDKQGRKTKTIVHQLEKMDNSEQHCWVTITNLFDKSGNVTSTEKIYDCND